MLSIGGGFKQVTLIKFKFLFIYETIQNLLKMLMK
jgi:hypothetical protein